jgi:hypothetical protein
MQETAQGKAPRLAEDLELRDQQDRALIERVVSHVKNWRILHTDYRHPLATLPTAISAVVGLHFWLNGRNPLNNPQRARGATAEPVPQTGLRRTSRPSSEGSLPTPLLIAATGPQ